MAIFELMPEFLMKENGTGLQLRKRRHPPEETLFPGSQAEEVVPDSHAAALLGRL